MRFGLSTSFRMPRSGIPEIHIPCVMWKHRVLDSGLAAARRPGMTEAALNW
jgi:hypothetical protein